MLCPTCPKRLTCTSPCDALLKDLKRIEKPFLREKLVSAKKMEKIEIAQAEVNHWRVKAEEEGPGLQARFYLLYEALKCLNQKQSICINLYYWEEATQREIAQVLGVTRQAVGQHMVSAHEEIKEFILIFSTIVTCLFAHNGEEAQRLRRECLGVWGALLTKEYLGVDIFTPCLQTEKIPKIPSKKDPEKANPIQVEQPILEAI
jgi:hypothetical protein